LPPRAPDGARHAHHLYIVRLTERGWAERDAVEAGLRDRNIGSSVHFRAIHLHSYYRDRLGVAPDDLPCATELSARSLTLPLFPAMLEEDVADVARALSEVLS
jgi:dTDP-4-amino-4,6-dideoxygalactose transaminase